VYHLRKDWAKKPILAEHMLERAVPASNERRRRKELSTVTMNVHLQPLNAVLIAVTFCSSALRMQTAAP
jgi:hypothetical protein